MMCLEKLDGKNFPSQDEYQQALNLTNLLVRKAEMVFSSHLAYWSALQPTHKHTVVKSNIYSSTRLKYNFVVLVLEYFYLVLLRVILWFLIHYINPRSFIQILH